MSEPVFSKPSYIHVFTTVFRKNISGTNYPLNNVYIAPTRLQQIVQHLIETFSFIRRPPCLALTVWQTPLYISLSQLYIGCCLNGRSVQPPSKSLIFWSFPNVLSLFDQSIWAESWNISSSKKLQFQGWLKLAYFWFFCFFVHNSPQNHPHSKCWGSFGKFRELAARWAQ